MKWLEIKHGDRTVGIIRDSGDHEVFSDFMFYLQQIFFEKRRSYFYLTKVFHSTHLRSFLIITGASSLH